MKIYFDAILILDCGWIYIPCFVVHAINREHCCLDRHDIFVDPMWLLHPNANSSRCVWCIYYSFPMFLTVRFDNQVFQPDRSHPKITEKRFRVNFTWYIQVFLRILTNTAFTCRKFKIFSEFQKNGCMRTALAGGRFAGSLLIMSVINSSANTDVLSICELLNIFNSNSYDKMFNCLFTKSPKGCEPFEIT